MKKFRITLIMLLLASLLLAACGGEEAEVAEVVEEPEVVEEAEVKPKIRIKLRSYDHKVIDNSARQIIDVVLRYGAEISGPVPLPTETHKYTIYLY